MRRTWTEINKQIKIHLLVCIALLFGEQCRPSFPFPYLFHESWRLKRVFSLLTGKNTAIQLHHFTFVQFALVKIRKQSWTAYDVVRPIFAPIIVSVYSWVFVILISLMLGFRNACTETLPVVFGSLERETCLSFHNSFCVP